MKVINQNTKSTNHSIACILGLQEDKENDITFDVLSKANSTKARARRARTNFSADAINYLEEIFKTNQYPDINEREILAKKVDTTEARIQVWFQNKRSRHRRRNTNAKTEQTPNDSFTSNESVNESSDNKQNLSDDIYASSETNSVLTTPVWNSPSTTQTNFSFNSGCIKNFQTYRPEMAIYTNYNGFNTHNQIQYNKIGLNCF